MTWDVALHRCRTCGHVQNGALDDWRADALVRLIEQTMATMKMGPERHQRLLNIVEDYGVSLRTAQRYVARARAA